MLTCYRGERGRIEFGERKGRRAEECVKTVARKSSLDTLQGKPPKVRNSRRQPR